MPVGVKQIDGKWRIVEPPGSSTISKTAVGNAVDGGGHASKADAMAQMRAINAQVTASMSALIPLVFAETGRRALRALYPLISEDAPTTQIHVAMEGSWEGHPSGPFSLTRADFEQIVTNFEASPNPIPLDYEHATEWAAKAPACGWVHGLEVRSDANGAAHLWAQVELSDEAAGFIRDGAYRFSSGVFVFEATDHVSGEGIGTELTSLALTNIPYLRGQQPIQLSRRAAATTQRKIAMDATATKEGVIAALQGIDASDISMAQLEAALEYAAAQEGTAAPDEAAAPPEAPMSEDVPTMDTPDEPAVEASAPAGEQEVEAADGPMPPDQGGAEADQALAALSPIAAETGMDMASLAAAFDQYRTQIAQLIQGGGDAAGAQMSDRQAELALSARDQTINAQAAEIEDLRAFKLSTQKEAAKAWACSMRDEGRILDDKVEEWAEMRLSNPDKAESLIPAHPTVPLKQHAAGSEPTVESEREIQIDESDADVKRLRADLKQLGWSTKDQDKAVRRMLSKAQKTTPARANA